MGFGDMDRRLFLAGLATSTTGPQRYFSQFAQGPDGAARVQGARSQSGPQLRFPVALNGERTAFIDQHGQPCFACGDAPQYLLEQLSKADIELYLSDRAARGINLIWLIAADRVYQTKPPYNLAGDAPFGSADFIDFNEPYWAYLDHVMQRCQAYGITALLMPLFVGLKDTQGYLESLKRSDLEVMEVFGKFLGNRYRKYPNLIWLLGGDADPNDAQAYARLDRLAVAIKAADPDHLMTLEASYVLETGARVPGEGYSSVDAHMIAFGLVRSWLDINWIYQPLEHVVSGSKRGYAQGLPCLLGEDFYELEHSTTAAEQRAEGYGSVLSGCRLGRLFGNGAIWPFNSPNASNEVNAGPPTWQSQLGSAGTVGQQLLAKLFRSRSFHQLMPDTSNAVMVVGADDGSVCARTADGKTIIAYLPSAPTYWRELMGRGDSVTIDMSKINDEAGHANCNWYHPGTGSVTSIGNVANAGLRSFTSPDADDWVLVIDSAGAGLIAPGGPP